MASDRSWGARAARARRLASHHPDAADLLTFFALLTEHQQTLSERWAAEGAARRDARSLRELVDAAWLVGAIPGTLSWLERSAPQRLASAVPDMRRLHTSDWRERLDEVLAGHGVGATPEAAAQHFVIEVLLQPMAERLAEGAAWAPGGADATRCAFCGSQPVVGALREEGQGARRTLTCAICSNEWTYLRLVCPGCGERTFDALPVYTAEQFPSARIEACDACRTYIKTIDVTKDGLAIPLVDDIATVALDLWARERGYVRLRGNVLRM